MAEPKRQIGVRLDPELYRRLKARAVMEGKSATTAVEEAFALWLAQPEGKPPKEPPTIRSYAIDI